MSTKERYDLLNGGLMRTKIIITYGPMIKDEKILEMAVSIADIVRINLSHGSEKEWSAAIEKVRTISKRLGKSTEIMADLPGPKIRIGRLDKRRKIKKGDEVRFSFGGGAAVPGSIPIEYDLIRYCRPGAAIYVGDGELKLEITKIGKREVTCRSYFDGIIESRKGLSLEGLEVDAEPPTSEDMELLGFAVANKCDMVAESFVRNADNIRKLRSAAKDVKIVSKIERKAALDSIDEIISESDMVMVARGDLALNVGFEKLSQAQRFIIKAAERGETPFIMATEVLASMVSKPVPTRAEVSDISNAISNNAYAIMLSNETSVGKFPLEAIDMLRSCISEAEHDRMLERSQKGL